MVPVALTTAMRPSDQKPHSDNDLRHFPRENPGMQPGVGGWHPSIRHPTPRRPRTVDRVSEFDDLEGVS